MGRIAVINPKIAIEQSLQRFPQNRQELLQARDNWNALLEQRQGRIAQLLPQNQLTPEAVHYPQALVEPGVWFHREWKNNKLQPGVRPDGLPEGKYVDFIRTARVPMGDWDFPDDIHHQSSISINNLGDAYDNLARYTTDNPNSLWQVYLTPGGVRAFEMAEQYTPREFAGGGLYRKNNPDNRFVQLNVDANYGKFSTKARDLKPRKLSQQEVQEILNSRHLPPPTEMMATGVYDYGDDPLNPTQAFSARISSKPGRDEDFVAFPLGEIGGGIENPYNRRIIDTYHDLPIMRSMALDGMQPGILPKSGLDLLEWHLASVPNPYRSGIEQKLEMLGLI